MNEKGIKYKVFAVRSRHLEPKDRLASASDGRCSCRAGMPASPPRLRLQWVRARTPHFPRCPSPPPQRAAELTGALLVHRLTYSTIWPPKGPSPCPSREQSPACSRLGRPSFTKSTGAACWAALVLSHQAHAVGTACTLRNATVVLCDLWHGSYTASYTARTIHSAHGRGAIARV